jgi:hypothetical protein
MGVFMKEIAKGMKTRREIASWRILSCGRVITVYPIRFAGTWNWYSKKAIPQARIATRNQGRWVISRRCPYQAAVMKVFEARRRRTVWRTRDMGAHSVGW